MNRFRIRDYDQFECARDPFRFVYTTVLLLKYYANKYRIYLALDNLAICFLYKKKKKNKPNILLYEIYKKNFQKNFQTEILKISKKKKKDTVCRKQKVDIIFDSSKFLRRARQEQVEKNRKRRHSTCPINQPINNLRRRIELP